MPQGITIAAFVLGSVFLLLALVGGGFKIFAAEISGKVGPLGRAIAGVLGSILVLGGLLGWFDPKTGPYGGGGPDPTPLVTHDTIHDPSPPRPHKEQPGLDISGTWIDNYGTEYSVTREGRGFSFTATTMDNSARSWGTVVVTGHQFTTTFDTSIPSRGNGSGTISEDGRVISGHYFDSYRGEYYLTLNKR